MHRTANSRKTALGAEMEVTTTLVRLLRKGLIRVHHVDAVERVAIVVGRTPLMTIGRVVDWQHGT